MRRFFRSAAFPILIVLVLAFFVSRLVNPGEQENAPTTKEFLAQVESDPASFESVEFEQKNQTLKITEEDGNEFTTAYDVSPRRRIRPSVSDCVGIRQNGQVFILIHLRQSPAPPSAAPAAAESRRR